MARPSTGGQPPPIYFCATWHSYGLKLAKALNGATDKQEALKVLDEIASKLFEEVEL
jgi:hypothetical protein